MRGEEENRTYRLIWLPSETTSRDLSTSVDAGHSSKRVVARESVTSPVGYLKDR